MSILMLAFALLPAGLAADRDPPAVSVRTCRTMPQMVDTLKSEPLRPQTLDQMPPADSYYAVLRIENGCEMPVLVSGRPSRPVRGPVVR